MRGTYKQSSHISFAEGSVIRSLAGNRRITMTRPAIPTPARKASVGNLRALALASMAVVCRVDLEKGTRP